MKIDGKTKQFFYLIIKIMVVCLAFYFIKNQLSEKEFDKQIFLKAVYQPYSWVYIFLILVLTFFNRFVEILKWQNLAQLLGKSLSVWESAKQVLIAITIGIFTPNGIGEYAGKALFYPKEKTTEVIFLNAVCNGVQVIYAVLVGLVSSLVFNLYYPFMGSGVYYALGIGVILIFILLFLIKKISIKGYSLQMLWDKIKNVPKAIHQRNLALAFLRYSILLHQYVLLYRFFGVEVDYVFLLMVVASIYLLSSSLPNFQMFDFAIKGSVALFLFGFLGVDQWVVTIVATLIWFLNLVLPISFGAVLTLFYKYK